MFPLAHFVSSIRAVQFNKPMTARLGDPNIAPPAVTAPKPSVPADPLMACDNDRAKFCPEIALTAQGLAGCLVLQVDQLSPSCQLLMADHIRFRKNCADEIKKFCANVPSGKGRVLACLQNNKTALSKKCLAVLSK